AILCCVALPPYAPLRHSRLLSGVGIDIGGWIVDLPERRPDSRIIVHRKQHILVPDQPLTENIPGLAERRILVIDGVPPAGAECLAAVGLSLVCLRICNAPTAANHHLRCDLIR